MIIGDLQFIFKENLVLDYSISPFNYGFFDVNVIKINFHRKQIPYKHLLFSAEDTFEDNPFIKLVVWKVYGNGNKYCINICLRENHEVIVAQLLLNEKFYPESVFIDHNIAKNLPEYPLPYPLMHLILYYTLLHYKAVMIHASGVIINNKTYLFSAFSGTGKTTIARWFHEKGYTVMNDDRIILRKINQEIIAYNSPMYHVQTSMAKPLGGIFYIQQYQENIINKISKVEAFTKMQQMIIRHNYHSQLIEKQLNNTEEILHQTKSYELFFKNSPEIVEDVLSFIQSK